MFVTVSAATAGGEDAAGSIGILERGENVDAPIVVPGEGGVLYVVRQRGASGDVGYFLLRGDRFILATWTHNVKPELVIRTDGLDGMLLQSVCWARSRTAADAN